MMDVEYFGARTIVEGRKEGLLADMGQGRHHFALRWSAAQLRNPVAVARNCSGLLEIGLYHHGKIVGQISSPVLGKV